MKDKINKKESLSKKAEEFERKYKRALADYQNLLKQTAKEKSEFVKFANEQLLHEIIPVYDNLKMALNHNNNDNNDNWLEGVRHVAKQFKDILGGFGVKEIKTIGEKFNHHAMEAIENEETAEKKQDGLVVKEIKPGYSLNDKIIIPARVIVYKYKLKNK